MDKRPYLIKVTRHPLPADAVEGLRANGTLPDDYKSRSVEESDFVKVEAANDAQAAARALTQTSLVFKGEDAEFNEVLDGGDLRLLDLEVPDA